jgi:YHS domain-containing protein
VAKRIGRSTLVAAAAFLCASALLLAHDPKKKSGESGETMPGCEEHHAAAMKASDELTAHLAEAKRSTTLAQMRTHVEAADKALAEMKAQMSQCMEMKGQMHGSMMGSGLTGTGMATGERKAAGKAVDPVCGMEVDSAGAPSVTYKGKTYYFCSDDDKSKFEKNPEQYLRSGGS